MYGQHTSFFLNVQYALELHGGKDKSHLHTFVVFVDSWVQIDLSSFHFGNYSTKEVYVQCEIVRVGVGGMLAMAVEVSAVSAVSAVSD